MITTGSFIRAARERGHHLDLSQLERLHSLRLLLPLYRVSDTKSHGRRVPVDDLTARGVHVEVVAAARDGRLRDPADEGYSAAWPYCRPTDADTNWWNGFLYSSWQLLELDRSLAAARSLGLGLQAADGEVLLAGGRRRVTLALVALATRYLPPVLGRLKAPSGASLVAVARVMQEASDSDLLRVTGLPPSELRSEAERLLLSAHGDPMIRWWKLIRHAGYSGWRELRGKPLACVWQRVAGEVLLRAHEALTLDGGLQPLPDLSRSTGWHPLHDRVLEPDGDGRSLGSALSDLGLSPEPRVLLLVEGQTEQLHMLRLLSELGLDRPSLVRIQVTHGSTVNPHLLARYVVTPRLAAIRGNVQHLDARPTALVIMMDPEGLWDNPGKQELQLRRLKEAVSEEFRAQGGQIAQPELDALVRLHVWQDLSYELSNFSDEDLTIALSRLIEERHSGGSALRRTLLQVRDLLAVARREGLDISSVTGRLGLGSPKVRLAELLWPTLRSKFDAQWRSGDIETPVLKVLSDVASCVERLGGGGIVIPRQD